MFLGHFAVALAAKRAAPKASLGTLVFAAQLADLLWPIFLLLGWEQVQIAPGITRVTPLDFVSYPWSHSLAMQLVWALALGIVYFTIRRESRGAIVAAACVPTHWLLDYISHRADMPLYPGSARYGLGLWNSLPATLFTELGLYALGIALYLRVTRAKDKTGVYALWSFLIFLLVAYIGSIPGPPPASVNVLALTALSMWLAVPWAAWADRHRSLV
jgi:membrane-bound metal-dependent hydrolase YbcI (DUF457 family)